MEPIAAKAEMLIDAPRDKVFAAFTSKAELCKFWLDDASADLSLSAKVEWTFMVPGAKDTVVAHCVNGRLLVSTMLPCS